jgi:hypothetical protein
MAEAGATQRIAAGGAVRPAVAVMAGREVESNTGVVVEDRSRCRPTRHERIRHE